MFDAQISGPGTKRGWSLLGAVLPVVVALAVRAAVPGDRADIAPAAPVPTPTSVTLDAVADSYVDQANPSANYGTNPNVYAALNTSLQARVTYVRFDLSTLPAYSTIKSASFQMYQDSATGLSPVTLTLGRCAATWKEATITWSTRPGLVAATSSSVGTTSGWVSWDAQALVQGWVSKTYSNYGVGVSGPAKGTAYSRRFMSRDKLPAPRLAITYYAPTPTPTPTPTPSATPTPTPRPCSDPYEPNDTYATAASLVPLDPAGYRALICSPTDTDYYSFPVALHDTIRVVLDELPKNYDLELYDSTGTRLRVSTNGGTASETITYTASNTTGTYRARVLTPAGEYDLTIRYHLTVQVTPFVEPVLVVNSTNDVDDGACNTTHCSLREALNAVNVGTASRVQFSIPSTDPGYLDGVWTIRPSSALPVVTRQVKLEGDTQTTNRGDTNPFGPELALDGSSAGVGVSGIVVSGASSSLIRQLVLSSWDAAAIRGEGTTQLTVTGCYIGTSAAGDGALPNQDGVVIQGGMSAHIGGGGSGEGNIIAGNERYGVHLEGTGYAQVIGNLIGVKRSGTEVLGNGDVGVRLDEGTDWSYVGGAGSGEANVIGGNLHGVHMTGAEVSHNKVYGNWIGLARTGERLPNSLYGVCVDQGHHNDVGGVDAAQKNRIGANGSNAVHLSDASQNTVTGNDIGFYEAVARSNNGDGVSVRGTSSYNTIARNSICNNSGSGIGVFGRTAIRNTFSRNVLNANFNKGINLSPLGEVANEGIQPPVVGAVTATLVRGTSCSLCTVEIFSAIATQAEVYEGTTTANASGDWSWAGTPHRPNVRATATDAFGNTSELTRCVDPLEPNDTLATAYPITVNLAHGDAYEGFICDPEDLDYYSFEAAAGDVVTAEVNASKHTTLRLYDATGHELASASDPWSLALRRIVYTVLAPGRLYARVESDLGESDAFNAYRLAVAVQPLAPVVTVWFDEGWLADTEVYKLIPDADGPASRTLVDVVADVSVDSSTPADLLVTVTIPGDPWGAPQWARERDCTGCAATDVTFDDRGGGQYRVGVHLDGDTSPYHRQVVMRFRIPSVARAGSLQATADARLAAASPIIGVGTSPELHVVDSVDAVIITSRHHLYEGSYDLAQAVDLLGSVTSAAQGPPRGSAGSRRAAIYFVDDYSDVARDWCNESWDPTSEDTANVATVAIDALLDDWLEDSAGDENVVILGDDDIIPFYRYKCPCEDNESDEAESSPTTLYLMTHNDYIATDNHFGDTNNEGWDHARVELDVGRIIGDNPTQMQQLFENGLAGPTAGDSPRAVLASCDGNDLDFLTTDDVIGAIRDWGYSASDHMVDNMDWRDHDLLDALGQPFTIFAFSDHANSYGVGTPPDPQTGDGLNGWDLTNAMVDADTAARRPFMGILGCRSGYSFVEGSMLDYFAAEGCSGMMADYGLSWYSPEGSEWYTEDVTNKFWRRLFPDSGETRSVGKALRRAKIDHDPTFWYCRHVTAVLQKTLFGIPWMTVPRGDAPAASHAAATCPTALADELRATASGAYELTSTLDASVWSLDRATAPGFDIVSIQGFAQDPDAGPTLPARMVEVPLPAGATVSTVSVTSEQPQDLGTLAIPTYQPGRYLVGHGTEGTWVATPSSAGTVPASPYTWTTVPVESHQVLHVKIVPVVWNAATGKATLSRRLTLRVAYTTTEAIGVAESGLDKHLLVPAETGTAWADVVNASDLPVAVTTTATATDSAGTVAGTATGGPFTIPAGATLRVNAPLPVVQTEGGYGVALRVLHASTEVGRMNDFVDVTTGYVRELEAPAHLVPGGGGTFAVTYANATATAADVAVGIEILTLSGTPVLALAKRTISVPARGEATASFAWDATGVSLGRYQVRASATPPGGAARSVTRIVEVRAGLTARRRLPRSE
jgi:CSLREA domain-containing protein